MPAIEPFHRLLGNNVRELNKEEICILEVEIFFRICDELNKIFVANHNNYHRLIKTTIKMEDVVLETNLIRNMIMDLITSGEYSLQGVAYYTKFPEEVILEVVSGKNNNPSFDFTRKIMELHRNFRSELYEDIVKKVFNLTTTFQNNYSVRRNLEAS